MAELTAPQQNRLLGQLANMLRATEGDIAAPEFLPSGLDVMGLVRQLMLPSAETVEKMSYGDPLFRMPMQSNIPITADREYLADIAGMIPFGAPAARPTARGIQDLVRQIQTEPPMGAVTMSAKPMGQGLIKIKQDAKNLSEKEFLDKYVTETLPEHLESGNFPQGVRQQEPHEFLPPGLLDPSEWDDWNDRSLSGATEKIAQFRQSLREGAEFPPVLIHSQKGAFPYVEDGHHRMAAYLDEGYKSVPVSFDASSLIKIWKEENQSPKKVSEIYKEYTQGLLGTKPSGFIDTVKLPASSDDIVGNPKINEDFVDLYHVTDEDSLAKIESSGVLDNTMATSNFQGYAPAVQGTYGWSSPERARFEVDRLADMTGSTEGLVILKVRVPKSEFNRLRPDEDSGIDDWRQSYLEGGSAAIEGPIPLSFVEKVYKGE